MAVKDRDDVLLALERAEQHLREVESDLARTRQSVLAIVEESPGITAAQPAERAGLHGPALQAFADTVRELLGDQPLSVQSARRAAMLAAAEEVWEGQLGPLLSSAQVRELLGGVSRQRVDELLRSKRLIGLTDSSSRRRFPAFQFRDGHVIGSLVAAFWIVAGSPVSDWTAASWCTSPHDGLDERTPVAWAIGGGDPERLALIASRDAARLGQ